MITDLQQLDPDARYTYADYLRWRFPERVELINGRIQLMGTPNGRHQRIAGKMQRIFSQFLQDLP
ncbi:MAG: Uma2 family endonuclease, partial [Saprospiraceae bacterium]